MALENNPPSPDPAQPAPVPKTSFVKTEVEEADKTAWAQAAEKKKLPLNEWVNQELNAAAKEENQSGSETK